MCVGHAEDERGVLPQIHPRRTLNSICNSQGWKRGRIFADFIFTTLPESGPEEFNRVFVVETKGLHLQRFSDTDYKRAVFEVCNKHAQQRDWSEFVPTMRSKVMRFEVVDEDEWQKRINRLLAG